MVGVVFSGCVFSYVQRCLALRCCPASLVCFPLSHRTCIPWFDRIRSALVQSGVVVLFVKSSQTSMLAPVFVFCASIPSISRTSVNTAIVGSFVDIATVRSSVSTPWTLVAAANATAEEIGSALAFVDAPLGMLASAHAGQLYQYGFTGYPEDDLSRECSQARLAARPMACPHLCLVTAAARFVCGRNPAALRGGQLPSEQRPHCRVRSRQRPRVGRGRARDGCLAAKMHVAGVRDPLLSSAPL